MAKAKDSSSLRQRKTDKASKIETTQEEKEPAASAKSPSSKSAGKSERGMTCFNWFFVLIFLTAVCGFSSFLLFQIIQFEIAAVRMKLSSIKDVGSQIEAVTSKLVSLESLDKDIAMLRKNDGEKSSSLTKLLKEQEKFSSMFKNEISELRDLMSAIESSAISPSEMTEVRDKLKVSSADVAQLVKEMSRLEQIFSQHKKQVSSIQQEVINLTADKTEMSTAIESIKSTVVHVRENIEKMGSEKNAGEASTTGNVFEKKISTELENLQRQISEIAGNSVEWLEKSTSAIEGRFKKSIEDLAKQFAELKVESTEPGQASADQSLLNSVASLFEKIERTDKRIVQLGEIIGQVGESQKKTDSLVTEQFGESTESLSAISEKVTESQKRDHEMWKSVSDITEELRTVRNELNSVKTIARILETRIEEMRTGQPERTPEPAAAPDMPEDVIPDPVTEQA